MSGRGIGDKQSYGILHKDGSPDIYFYASASLSSCNCRAKRQHLNSEAINLCPTCSLLHSFPKVAKYQASFIRLSSLTDDHIQLNSRAFSPAIMAHASQVCAWHRHSLFFFFSSHQETKQTRPVNLIIQWEPPWL